MADKIADAFVEIGARTSKFERGMSGVRKRLGRIGSGFKSLAKTASVAFLAIGASATLLGKTFTDASSSMENLEVRLTTMLRSQKKAAEGMQFFSDIASKVPFSIDKIAEAGVTLQAMGADFKKWLPVLSDLAAFMGEDVVFAASAMGRAFAGGAGAADVFREKGVLEIIKASSGIRDFSNKTLPEFRDAMFKAFVDPTGKVAGAAKAMAETWTGQLSMVGDSIFKLKDELGKTLLPAMKEIVTFTIKPLINEWAAWVKENKALIKEDVAFHIHNIKMTINLLGDAMRAVGKVYAEFRTTFVLASLDMRKTWIDFTTAIKVAWEKTTGGLAKGWLLFQVEGVSTINKIKIAILEMQSLFSRTMSSMIRKYEFFTGELAAQGLGEIFGGKEKKVIEDWAQAFSDSSKEIQEDIAKISPEYDKLKKAQDKTTADRIKQFEDAGNKEKASTDSLIDGFLQSEMDRVKASLKTNKDMGKNEEDFTKKVQDENKKRNVSFVGLTDILKKIQEGAFVKAGKSPLAEIAKVTTKPKDQFTGTLGVKEIKDQTSVAKDSNAVLKEMNNTLKTKVFVPAASMG